MSGAWAAVSGAQVVFWVNAELAVPGGGGEVGVYVLSTGRSDRVCWWDATITGETESSRID